MTDDNTRTRILLVEDSPSLSAVYQGYLQADEYTVEAVASGTEALALLDRRVPELVLLDLKLPDMSGMDVLRRIRENDLDCSVVIITAHGSMEVAVEAMREGATDFLAKPFDGARLRVTLANLLEQRRLTRIVASYEHSLARDHFHRFIGRSLAMQTVYRIIESAAPSKATVFVTGPSGTGKELCAEAIHEESPRGRKPFVALNCAAIPRDLMESEIFGHVKGAFTGAVSNRDGAATRANGGTLFLDELCEMDLDLQSKLLRFIQTGSFQRVGDTREQQVDIRFVCATNRDPLEEVRAGRFREDLYYRLNVIPLPLPPLRERGDDVTLIAEELLRDLAQEEGKRFRGLTPDVRETLLAYPWPGNVRELENLLRNIVVLNDGEQITIDMLPAHVRTARSPLGALSEPAAAAHSAPPRDAAPGDEAGIRPLWLEEKDLIERAIALCDGNVPKAAVALQISASTIYRKRVAWEEREAGESLVAQGS